VKKSDQEVGGVNEAARVPTEPLRIENMGSPLRLTNVPEIAGISAGAAQSGQMVEMWTALFTTSDDTGFYPVVEGLTSFIRQAARNSGSDIAVERANTILLVIKADRSAELWLDTAAVALKCAVKRRMTAGTVLFDRDIADVTAMSFPNVSIEATDQVICIFRQDWRFGLAFEMNPEGSLDLESFCAGLGSLYRQLRYTYVYKAFSNPVLLKGLIKLGWFPFVEIISDEFRDLLKAHENGFDLGKTEELVISKFTKERLDIIYERWMQKPQFSTKSKLLKSAITAFASQEPVAVIKIILTEIEGILNDAHRRVNEGRGAKLKPLLVFVEAMAERRAGGQNTLLFTRSFGEYLREYTFASFEPDSQVGIASSRHAVGHGAADQDSYTMVRALQAILTLDQLAFYL
jgi:hypothetical protein